MRWTLMKYLLSVNVTGWLVSIHEVAADKCQKIHSEKSVAKFKCWSFSLDRPAKSVYEVKENLFAFANLQQNLNDTKALR